MTNYNDIENDTRYIKILDKGFVGLRDVMGNDADIAESARVSYGSGTKTIRDNENLIRYLVKHHHTSPLEMAEAKFHIKAPIFLARQQFRHRTASPNEMSGRYSIIPDDWYVPGIDILQPQSVDNKQGRSGQFPVEESQRLQDIISENMKNTYKTYCDLIGIDEDGEKVDDEDHLARELGRIILPQSMYTEYYWKQDLKNLLHLINLRVDSHAQYEIRVMAQAMYDLIQPYFPATIQAFDDYVRHSVTVSRMEKEIIRLILSGKSLEEQIADKGSEKEFRSYWNMSQREFKDFRKEWEI